MEDIRLLLNGQPYLFLKAGDSVLKLRYEKNILSPGINGV